MKVSIIIPTYKPGDYIRECLESLFHQDLSCDEYEIIIILNGCCEPYFSNLHKIINDANCVNVKIFQTDIPGVSNARNIGIDNATGKYILFVDDDDWVSEHYLTSLLSIASPKTIACSNVILKDSIEGKALPHFLSSAYKRCKTYDKLTLFNSRSFLSSVWCKLIPNDVIGDRRFDSKYKLGEDSLFMFVISDRIKGITLSSENIVYYVRARENSVSRRHYSFTLRVKVALSLTLSYFHYFLKSPFKYNFLLFASRVFATLIKLRKKEYV